MSLICALNARIKSGNAEKGSNVVNSNYNRFITLISIISNALFITKMKAAKSVR